ncbi:aminodeoxychorismate/anthranilate synthase component II [Candidatus Vidania fulgoroideorum]
MIILLDNYDSYTHNISNVFKYLNFKVKIFKKQNLKKILKIKNIDFICIGPGTSFPKINDFKIISNFIYKHIPILGICLGHQIIGKIFKCKVFKSLSPLHGERDLIYSFKNHILNNVPFISKFCRYNSLYIKENKNIKKISLNKNKEAMLITHKKYPIIGIQFHPESILSFYGIRILKNICLFFTNLCLKK